MSRAWRRTRASALAAAFAVASLNLHAGSVASDLRNAARAQPGARLAVIIALEDRIDPSQYAVQGHRARDGRLVAALREHASRAQGPLRAALAGWGAEGVETLWINNSIAARVPAALIDAIAAFPGVRSVYVDTLAMAPVASVGTSAPREWNLDAVHAGDIWSLGFRGAGMVIANMDTGVDALHPDLSAGWRPGGWYDPSGQHATPYDANGHGTQTMGLMVGGSAGGTSIGVAPDAQWIAVKMYDDAGVSSYSRIHLSFQWLLDPDGDPATQDAPDVVNLSWGLAGTSGQCITEFEIDLEALKAASIAFAISSGNDGPAAGTSLSPANNPAGFSAGAVDASLAIASFSARGPSACTGAPFPNVVAPGVNVNTTDLSFGGLPLYMPVTGSSFSAPHVAATMALLLQAFPTSGVGDIEAAITMGATDLGEAGADNAYGSGLLDALAAYDRLAAVAPALPQFTSEPVTVATQDAPYVYVASATDPAKTTLTYALTTAPAGMTIDAGTGEVRWTPGNAQVGANSVAVRATNALGGYATQSFTVTVANVNDAPQAAGESYTVLSGTVLTVAAPGVLANDGDPDHDALAAVLASGPAHGTLVLNADGSFTYTSSASYAGADSFAYRAFDGSAYSAPAVVSIGVLANHAPVAVDDTATAPARTGNGYTAAIIKVLSNDTDADGNLDASTVAIASSPTKGGAVVANANGTVSYTPKKGFKGTDAFGYRVRDKLGAASNVATVTVTVQ